MNENTEEQLRDRRIESWKIVKRELDSMIETFYILEDELSFTYLRDTAEGFYALVEEEGLHE